METTTSDSSLRWSAVTGLDVGGPVGHHHDFTIKPLLELSSSSWGKSPRNGWLGPYDETETTKYILMSKKDLPRCCWWQSNIMQYLRISPASTVLPGDLFECIQVGWPLRVPSNFRVTGQKECWRTWCQHVETSKWEQAIKCGTGIW